MSHTLFNPSKKAEKHINDPVEKPTNCPYCKSAVTIVNNSVVFGKEQGVWPWLYRCSDEKCGAYVGMHPQTSIPLGTLADEKTRFAREQAKALLEPLWAEGGKMSRHEACNWLAARLGISIRKFHIEWLSAKTCQAAISILQKRNGMV